MISYVALNQNVVCKLKIQALWISTFTHGTLYKQDFKNKTVFIINNKSQLAPIKTAACLHNKSTRVNTGLVTARKCIISVQVNSSYKLLRTLISCTNVRV